MRRPNVLWQTTPDTHGGDQERSTTGSRVKSGIQPVLTKNWSEDVMPQSYLDNVAHTRGTTELPHNDIYIQDSKFKLDVLRCFQPMSMVKGEVTCVDQFDSCVHDWLKRCEETLLTERHVCNIWHTNDLAACGKSG